MVKPSIIAGMACVTLLASCSMTPSNAPVTVPVSKKPASDLEIRAWFFTTPEDFGFVPGQVEPGVAGTYSMETGERLVKSLSRRRGFGLFDDAPERSTARSGEKRQVKVVREFIYPAEYKAPELKKSSDGAIQAVTPATPTEFETRELGVVLDYTARKTADGRIAFTFDLERSSFLGFVNYGTPITAPAKGWFGLTKKVTLTENRIEMPVFDVKSLRSGVLVKEGDFIALGGFIPGDRPENPHFTAFDGPGGESSGRPFVALIQVGGAP